MLEKLKKAVCDANLDLVAKGVVIYTWGNVSGISEDRKYMVIKPSGVDYDGMSPEDMVVVDIVSGERMEEINSQALHRDGLYLRRRLLRPVHPPERGDDAAGVFRPPLLLEASAQALGRDFARVRERISAQRHSGRGHAHEQHHGL